MTAAATSITVRVPMAIRRRGGRKVIITPEGATAAGAAVQTRGDPTLVKALARAHRWRRLLEGRRFRSLRELAAAEGVDRGYVARLLQLTLLAPDIVEAILDGRQPEDLGLPSVPEAFPNGWDEQRASILGAARCTSTARAAEIIRPPRPRAPAVRSRQASKHRTC